MLPAVGSLGVKVPIQAHGVWGVGQYSLTCTLQQRCSGAQVRLPLQIHYLTLLLRAGTVGAYMHKVNPNIFQSFLLFHLCITFVSLFTYHFYFFQKFPYFSCHSIHLKSLSV